MIRTLVVDDDFRVSHIHSDYVSRVEGFEVVAEAATVAQALDAVHTLRPDLLLLDVFLPDGSGLDVLRQLSGDEGGDRPDAIMITADRDITSVRIAMKLGAVGYLVKPFGSADLAKRLLAYRELQHRMDVLGSIPETDQADVDALFSAARPPAVPRVPAKGHSAPTLALLHQILRTAHSDLSAAEAAELTGVSRATAQRYLSYLVKEGMVRLELRYGATGRPEHRYRIAN
ncbi:response regulator [Streptomyces sp. NL15-2K]|uniref:response regulator n=1 Tax=Streptomyces sp. NL15-2K TaxID=376149 RepID=UPI000F5810B8|nr:MULTISPECIES: response regulator [Actinomycetes]WKX13653.1 response regulator [Kutzneria buriramensis]GCB44947.1 response regulator citB of citrate metabolism [Streptomyces sp. NL15-2K]